MTPVYPTFTFVQDGSVFFYPRDLFAIWRWVTLAGEMFDHIEGRSDYIASIDVVMEEMYDAVRDLEDVDIRVEYPREGDYFILEGITRPPALLRWWNGSEYEDIGVLGWTTIAP